MHTLAKYLNLPDDMDYETQLELIVSAIELENLEPSMPASLETIREAIAEGDTSLNTIPLYRWDQAAGFLTSGHNCRPISGNRFRELTRKTFGITVCCSEGVCVLKTAARMLAEKNLHQIRHMGGFWAVWDTENNAPAAFPDGFACVTKNPETAVTIRDCLNTGKEIPDNRRISIQTPHGILSAKTIPDDHFPGIDTGLFNEASEETASVITEWHPEEKRYRACIWGPKEMADGLDPASITTVTKLPELKEDTDG